MSQNLNWDTFEFAQGIVPTAVHARRSRLHSFHERFFRLVDSYLATLARIRFGVLFVFVSLPAEDQHAESRVCPRGGTFGLLRGRSVSADKQMAGSSWAASVHSLTILKRSQQAPVLLQAACVPNYVPITSCIGDCKSATQTFTQVPFTCTSLPQNKIVNCSISMPCTCNINDFPLDASVKTCGNCDATPEGQRCYFVCANSTNQLTPSSVRFLQCLGTGWSQIPLSSYPFCTILAPSCPPILTSEDLTTNFYTKCVGATQNDVCQIACNPGYYAPNGWYEATCSQQSDGTLAWNRPLTCQCQPCREFGDIDCPTVSNLSFGRDLV